MQPRPRRGYGAIPAVLPVLLGSNAHPSFRENCHALALYKLWELFELEKGIRRRRAVSIRTGRAPLETTAYEPRYRRERGGVTDKTKSAAQVGSDVP